MIVTPNVVTKMKPSKINSLLSFVSKPGKGSLTDFSKECIEQLKNQLARIEPTGSNQDYYQWGVRQGALKAHEIYANLAKILEAEKKKREDVNVVDSTKNIK